VLLLEDVLFSCFYALILMGAYKVQLRYVPLEISFGLIVLLKKKCLEISIQLCHLDHYYKKKFIPTLTKSNRGYPVMSYWAAFLGTNLDKCVMLY
jgi:hypothetical protein